jgi:hypothetical protein
VQALEGHRATAHLANGSLNDYVKHLLALKDSPKAIPMTEKGNVPFGKADLAAFVLASVSMMWPSVPMTWQNQYNINHTTVPESMRALLPDLEAIELVMVEKQQEKLKAKGKAATTRPKAKINPKHKVSGGLIG